MQTEALHQIHRPELLNEWLTILKLSDRIQGPFYFLIQIPMNNDSIDGDDGRDRDLIR